MRHLIIVTYALLLAFDFSLAHGEMPAKAESTIRVATYNVSLYRDREGQLIDDLESGDEQARKIAEVIRRVQPDILLLNEFDYMSDANVARTYFCYYLYSNMKFYEESKLPRLGPLLYRYYKPVNTGVPSGLDLDRDNVKDGPNDAYGYGRYPGQYGMALYSRFPIKIKQAKTFQKFLWKDMPNAKLPINPQTGKSYYSDEILNVFRLSSKSHWDVPVELKIGNKSATLHLLCSHPTPPGFDGPEDRNGRRNHDEIRLWADYIEPSRSDYLVDDRGNRGGLTKGSHFVILGDLNADPVDGDDRGANINQLLKHPLVNGEFTPSSEGGVESSQLSPKLNSQQRGDPSHDTANFGKDDFSNMRVDYVLPSRTLKVVRSGVFWPKRGESGSEAIAATDHRLVWVDIQLPSPTPSKSASSDQ